MPTPLLAPKGQQLREDLLPNLDTKTIPFVDKHIGDQLMPVNLRNSTEIEFFTIDAYQYLRRRNAKISGTGAFAISGATGVRGTSSMDLYRHGGAAKESDIKAKGEPYAEGVASKLAYAAVSIEREIDIASNFADDVAVDPTVAARGQVAGLGLSNTGQDPVKFIIDGKNQIEQTIGEALKGVVIPWISYTTFVNHPLVQARLYGGGYVSSKDVVVPVDKVAQMLGVEEILRPFGRYQAAAGAALTDIWDPLKFYCYFNRPEWSDDLPMLGSTMRLQMNGLPPGHEEGPAPLSAGVMMSSYTTPNPAQIIVVASVEQRMLKHPKFLDSLYKIKFPGA